MKIIVQYNCNITIVIVDICTEILVNIICYIFSYLILLLYKYGHIMWIELLRSYQVMFDF